MQTVIKDLNEYLEMAYLEVTKIDVEKQSIMNQYARLQQDTFDFSSLTHEEINEMMNEEVRDFVLKLMEVKRLFQEFPSNFDREIHMENVPAFHVQKTIKRLDMLSEELASEVVIELDMEMDKLEVRGEIENVKKVLGLIDKIEELTEKLLELTSEIEVLLEL